MHTYHIYTKAILVNLMFLLEQLVCFTYKQLTLIISYPFITWKMKRTQPLGTSPNDFPKRFTDGVKQPARLSAWFLEEPFTELLEVLRESEEKTDQEIKARVAKHGNDLLFVGHSRREEDFQCHDG